MAETGRNGQHCRRRVLCWRRGWPRAVARAGALALSAATISLAVGGGVGIVGHIDKVSTRAEQTQVEADRAGSARSHDDVQAGLDPKSDRASQRARPSPSTHNPERSPTPTPSPATSASRSPKTVTAQPGTATPRSTAPTQTRVPTSASGELSVVEGNTAGQSAAEQRITYRVEVEEGLPFDETEAAEVIHHTLTDERGWSGVGDVGFSRTDGDAQLRIVLASPDLTDSLCLPLKTGGTLSCRVEDRVVLNAQRWARGTPAYQGDLTGYRTYLVNHEVGHVLGHSHADCPGSGEPAPVMMQQTKGIGQCTTNPWPTVATN